jgi:hypothetical protein
MGEMFPLISDDDVEHFVTEGFGDASICTEVKFIVDGSLNTTGIFGELGSATLGDILGSGTNGLAWHLTVGLGIILGRSLNGLFREIDTLYQFEC